MNSVLGVRCRLSIVKHICLGLFKGARRQTDTSDTWLVIDPLTDIFVVGS